MWILRFVLLYTDDLPDNVLCNIAMYADNTTLYSWCDWAFDLWQYLQLNSQFEYDLGDTAEWVRKRLVDINARKTLLVSLDHFRNCCAISVKMDSPVFNEKSFIKLLVLSFSSKSDWGSYIVTIAKFASNKIRALIRSMIVFLLRLQLSFIAVELPCYCCHIERV